MRERYLMRAGVAILGVVGKTNTSNQKLLKSAQKLGKLIAESGHIVLTGGHHEYKEDSVKHAALLGALDVGSPSRFIGVIGIPPDRITHKLSKKVGKAEQGLSEDGFCHWVYAHTGLSSIGRNPITGRTPDVMIALEGKKGTAQEVSEALIAKRKVVFLNSWETLESLLTTKPEPKEIYTVSSEEEAVDKAFFLIREQGGSVGDKFPSEYSGLPSGLGSVVTEAIEQLREWLMRNQ